MTTTTVTYWYRCSYGSYISGLKGIKICWSPNSGMRISAARAARRIPMGAGFAEFGCIMVRITRRTLIRNTEMKKATWILLILKCATGYCGNKEITETFMGNWIFWGIEWILMVRTIWENVTLKFLQRSSVGVFVGELQVQCGENAARRVFNEKFRLMAAEILRKLLR